MKIFTHVSVIGLAVVTSTFSGCQKPDQAPAQPASTPEHSAITTLSIGFQKSSLNLLVAKQQKLFEQQFPDAKIEWREFPAGPQLLEALSVGAVDFGFVGNTPPIFAQAANKPLSYVGYQSVAAASLALVVHQAGQIKTIQDLKGKRIALQKGSSAHELLAKVLKKANLSWQDIQPIWLPPADARAAFDKQAIDAWVIWDPFLTTAEAQGHAQVLINSTAFPTTYDFYIGNPEFLKQHSQVAQKLIQGVNQSDQWVIQHPDQAVQIYAQSTGLSSQIAQQVVDKRPKPAPVYALTPEVISNQQQIADLFKQEQLIPVQINIQQSVWTGK